MEKQVFDKTPWLKKHVKLKNYDTDITGIIVDVEFDGDQIHYFHVRGFDDVFIMPKDQRTKAHVVFFKHFELI